MDGRVTKLIDIGLFFLRYSFWLTMPYSCADNCQERDFDGNDNKEETTQIITTYGYFLHYSCFQFL